MKSDLNKLLAKISNQSPIENLTKILPGGLGKMINNLREEADRVDRELDLTHQCIKELYEIDAAVPIIKKYLNKISEL